MGDDRDSVGFAVALRLRQRVVEVKMLGALDLDVNAGKAYNVRLTAVLAAMLRGARGFIVSLLAAEGGELALA